MHDVIATSVGDREACVTVEAKNGKKVSRSLRAYEEIAHLPTFRMTGTTCEAAAVGKISCYSSQYSPAIHHDGIGRAVACPFAAERISPHQSSMQVSCVFDEDINSLHSRRTHAYECLANALPLRLIQTVLQASADPTSQLTEQLSGYSTMLVVEMCILSCSTV